MAGGPRWWGWHALDPAWAERFVAEVGLPRRALVVDVGAGTGALTRPLLEAGARVIAVEAQPERAAHLRRRFGHDVRVVQADATDLRLPTRPYWVVANPPFAVTTGLLRRILQPGTRLAGADLILPVGHVRRWAGAGAPAAARWGRDYDVRPGREVPATAFRPPATTPVRVLRIRSRRP